MLTFVLRAGQAEAWKNGSPPSAAVPYAAFTPTHRPMLGRMNPQTDPAYFYRGQMDEVRVCRVARPADWIWATHMTMASNGAFTSYLIPSTPVPWDEDGDGMADAWEIQHLGDTNALPGDDEDEDGFSNLGEYTAGTVPTSAADRFEVDLSLSGSVGGVRFVTRAAGGPPHYPDMTRYYRLESASNLLDGGWYWVPGYDEILGAGQTVTYTNANWPAFYRGKAFLIQDGTP
jgi:hypothetical protein